MRWPDVAMIVFSVVAANHLGLVAAAESIIHRRLPVVNCPKCMAFWSVLAYGLGCEILAADHFVGINDMVSYHFEHVLEMLAVAFLSAWSAIWLDLFMGIIDHLYLIIYEQIYSATNPADTDAISTSDTVSDVSDGNG